MRYYFDLVNGVEKVDLSGAEFKNEGGARQEAILRALSFTRSSRLETYEGFETISVRDGTGRIVIKVRIKH